MRTATALDSFHPVLRTWFERRFEQGPTEAQLLGWETIAKGEDTLVAAPTGSGKTLAAFLVAIDRCLVDAFTPNRDRVTSVVYVSPLRALTVDISENLKRPLEEMAEIAVELGYPRPEVRVAVRNGDTPQSDRAAMVRHPPEIVVTTPESLYLLATSASGRRLLSTVETVIVDEIHALARDKRGSHLSLTLERLDAIVIAAGGRRPVRVGCSATQRPIATIARLLVGAGPDRDRDDGSPACQVVDVGHRRPLDVEIVVGTDELGAVSTNEQLAEIVEMLASEIVAHTTTLIFVNTRRMAERLAHLLSEDLGEDAVTAHHGSLSMERRLLVEARLRAGDLRAVVATASLELGIDVGPIDLVCQLGSPRAIATFLQRVGRAEHRRNGVPKGRIYPMTRDELVECTALLAAVRAGTLDAVEPPVAPLDILAQQLVAECASRGDDGVSELELAAIVRGAAPYAALGDDDLERVVTLVSEGVVTGRGRRGAHLHRDRVNRRLHARRGARLTATTSGGAIPELADYRVVTEPEGAFVGTVHEDFAIETMSGDIFLLGSNSWRVARVETGTVRVTDAHGAAPTIPFWLGEAPARTDELADAVSALRDLVENELVRGGTGAAVDAAVSLAGIGATIADQVVAYLAAARAELGTLPTKQRLVIERFFDDAGGMQLVVHSPFGARINRGFGLALRKRFCRTFDFELQAAANDDAIVLSLGPQHAFPLEEVSRYLSPDTVREVLTQAVLATPMFTSRWRWNLSRSLVSPRYRGSRHLPPAIQRMEADDLMAAVFPGLAACQENVTGPIEIPDHPLVHQTLADCYTEAMDLDGLVSLVRAVRDKTIAVHCVDTTEPSVLSHEILNGRPYTFLDDAPLEERRTRAVSVRRGIPLEAHDLTQLDPAIVAEVAQELHPSIRNPDELHDLLLTLVLCRPVDESRAHFDALCRAGRAMEVQRSGVSVAWCATESRPAIERGTDGPTFVPDHHFDTTGRPGPSDRGELVAEIVRGHLEILAPVTVDELCAAIGGVTPGEARTALARIAASGGVLELPDGRWCAKRIIARIHSRQRDRLRRSFSAVPARDFIRFSLRWQHVAPGTKLRGDTGLAMVLAQLQGVEAAVGAWEESILPSRVVGYHARLLDDLCANGVASWARTSLRADPTDEPRRGSGTPSRATPITLARREDLAWLLTAARMTQRPGPASPGAGADVVAALEDRGALFFTDLCELTGRMPSEIAEALWDCVARGLVVADGFQAVRALLAGRHRHVAVRSRRPDARTALRRTPRLVGNRSAPALAGGRWSLLVAASPEEFDPDELAEAVAVQLLERWGVVFRELATRESLAVTWREVLWALRRLEARGVARGGRFVAGVAGEQFALPEALTELRLIHETPPDATTVTICAADPLNLTGIVLPGPRVPARRNQFLSLVDGVVVESGPQRPARRAAVGATP